MLTFYKEADVRTLKMFPQTSIILSKYTKEKEEGREADEKFRYLNESIWHQGIQKFKKHVF